MKLLINRSPIKTRKELKARLVKKKSPNPLRYDPTRTTDLQNSLVRELKKRMDALKVAILKKIVQEDALGLKPSTILSINKGRYVTRADMDDDDKRETFDEAQEWSAKVMLNDFRTMDWETRNKILNGEVTTNGGPGSGNFGHAGRKGEVGGSSNSEGFSAVLYHGTGSDFDKFDLSKLHTGADSEGGKSFYGHGAYLTGEPWKAKMYAMSSPTGKVYSVKTSLNNPFVVKGTGAGDLASALKEAGHDPNLSGQALTDRLKSAGHDGIVVLKNGENKVNEVSVFDPIGLSIIHKETVEAFDHTKKKTITFNTAWKFNSDPEKLKSFKQWLKTQMKEAVGAPEEELLQKYIKAGYEKGAARSFDDYAQKHSMRYGPGEGDFYKGSKKQFLQTSFSQPVAQEKVELLASRAYSDLEGVTDAMEAVMARTLTDGLVEGKSPYEIGRDLAKNVDDIGITRATTIARTEIVRAHAEGQLLALENLGVAELGVEVEWSTTGDSLVCPECSAMEGTVIPIDEAKGMIPYHPNCRCAWVPANVGESKDDKRSQKSDNDDDTTENYSTIPRRQISNEWTEAAREAAIEARRQKAGVLSRIKTAAHAGLYKAAEIASNPAVHHAILEKAHNFAVEQATKGFQEHTHVPYLLAAKLISKHLPRVLGFAKRKLTGNELDVLTMNIDDPLKDFTPEQIHDAVHKMTQVIYHCLGVKDPVDKEALREFLERKKKTTENHSTRNRPLNELVSIINQQYGYNVLTGLVTHGGKGSGDFGHSGRKGEVGGSSEESESGPSEAAKSKKLKEPVPNAKAAAAKASHKLVDKKIQRYAEEHNEPRLAKVVGGISHPDSEPMDVSTSKALIEMKTIVDNSNGKITMDSYSQVRKIVAEKETGKQFHTIVSDDTKVFEAKGEGKHGPASARVYYYRRGVAGSARIESMYKCKDEAELLKLMKLPEDKLPDAAKRTDGHLRVGTWKPFKDEKGKGFENTKTGKIFRAKK